MSGFRIDLRSDTKTRPTSGMRRAIAEAEVGDEQADEDPSVKALCSRVAQLLGKEAALFLPSGTMCNQIAFLVHCRPGDEIIAADISHIVSSESAGAAALAGAQIRAIGSERGLFLAEDVKRALRPSKANAPMSRLIHIEQTVNRGGGAIWPIELLEGVYQAAREAGLIVHIDGARLLNAAVAARVNASSFCSFTTSVWLDFSKGLGCPVGAVLAGPADFISAARRWKFRLGGAMRQAGVLAAAGLYALDHHVERLAEDHANARRLADLVRGVKGLRVLFPVETNLIFIDIAETGKTAQGLARELASRGIGIGVEGPTLLRAVTHLDIPTAGIETAATAIGRYLATAI